EHHRDQAQPRRHRRAGGDKIVDRLAGIPVRRAEIPLQNTAQIGEELHIIGLVQAVLGLHGRNDLLRHALGVGKGAARHRMHDDKGEQDDHKHGDQHHAQPFQDKFSHSSSSPAAKRRGGRAAVYRSSTLKLQIAAKNEKAQKCSAIALQWQHLRDAPLRSLLGVLYRIQRQLSPPKGQVFTVIYFLYQKSTVSEKVLS